MLTKTFRAQNMLMALKNVQTELGPDAMIISMREIPMGSIWAAWRKPGVEIIASKSSQIAQTPPQTREDVNPLSDNQRKIFSPSSEDLKLEIENLKKLVSGEKLSNSIETTTSPSIIKQKPVAKQSSNFDDKNFDASDFTDSQESRKPQFEQISKKSTNLLEKTKTIIVDKSEQPPLPPKLMEIKQKLVDQGINNELIEKIISTNIDALSPSILNDFARLDRFIKHQLSVCLPTSRKSIALVPSRIMVLAGTSGSGKTSCCAKLASFYTITMGKKVVWIEADTVKTSAIAEARTYTETLGIPLFLAYTPQELAELIDSQSDADLILVDTASCNPRNESSIVEFGSYLSNIPSGSAYLVVSATTKEQDLFQTEKVFQQFGLKGIILTKTDETGTYGSCFNLLCQSKLPLYFYTSGIQIFGNLKPGNPEVLVNAVLSGEFPRE